MANDSKPAKAEPAKTMTAKLRCLDHRGETINTRWGPVKFDADGLAELEVPEGELQMLRDIKPHSWLAEDHASYQAELEVKKKPVDPKGDKK